MTTSVLGAGTQRPEKRTDEVASSQIQSTSRTSRRGPSSPRHWPLTHIGPSFSPSNFKSPSQSMFFSASVPNSTQSPPSSMRVGWEIVNLRSRPAALAPSASRAVV